MYVEWLAGGHLTVYFLALGAAGISAYGQMPIREWLRFMVYHAGIMAWLWPLWLCLYLYAHE